MSSPSSSVSPRMHAATVVAMIALVIAAVAGLVWGPGRGVGTDDQVQRIAAPSYAVTPSPMREKLAPASPREERLRFAVQGGSALIVLLFLLSARRRPSRTSRA